MDTQGIFDRQLNQSMTTALICLSTLMSSYQIYNLDRRIQEDHLDNMAYFSAYTDLIDDFNNNNSYDNTSNDKVGQTLSLLVRDWQNFEDNFDLKNCLKETEQYQKDFLSSSINNTVNDSKHKTRNKLSNTFDKINVRLCPHPGHLVTEGLFSGNLNNVREEFKIHIDYIISDILKNLESKRISSNMNLICSDVPEFMQKYVELYRNIKESLPESRTILETTSKISQTGAKTNTVKQYKQKMLKFIKLNSPDSEEIKCFHNNARDQAYNYFNSIFIMGEEDEIKLVMSLIESEIEEELKRFLLMSVNKNLLYRVNQIVNIIIQNIMILFNMDLNEFGLQIAIPFLIVFRYIVGFVLPSSLYSIFSYILGNIIWIFIGMFILQISQKETDTKDKFIKSTHVTEIKIE
jgi:atlastin